MYKTYSKSLLVFNFNFHNIVNEIALKRTSLRYDFPAASFMTHIKFNNPTKTGENESKHMFHPSCMMLSLLPLLLPLFLLLNAAATAVAVTTLMLRLHVLLL